MNSPNAARSAVARSTVPSTDALLALIDRFADQPVAMLVDLVVDRYVRGTPKRISREAPVLILRYDGEDIFPGGGANAVANVAALGGRPLPLGAVGDDRPGRQLLDALDARGVTLDGIAVRAGFRTPTKTRIVAGGRHAIKQQVVRYDVEDVLSDDLLSSDDGKPLPSALAALIESARVAVASDYGYGAVRPGAVASLRRALAANTPLVGDSRYALDRFAGLDGATPNLEELEAVLGRAVRDDEDLRDAGRAVRDRLNARFLLVTRGSSGMSLIEGESAWHLPVHGTDQVADVTGAGDTVIGTFALALAAGASPLAAACLANYAGGLVVMKMGTATLTRDELRDAVRRDASPLDALRSGR
ncbi:MAG: PfkB family carbohydrate kinase [Acidobacteriota bacterium]